MNDIQVLELLSETDAYAPGTPMPVSAWSRDTALSEIERRLGMEPRTTATQEKVASPAQQVEKPSMPSASGPTIGAGPKKKALGRPILVGAAAAVLVLIVGLGTWAVIGGDKDAAFEPEVAVVMAAIEARNSGDIATYKASLTGAALKFEQDFRLAEALSYANRSDELVDCLVTDTVAGVSTVACESTSIDDFYGAGGIVPTGTMTFLVTADGKISDITDVNESIPWEETELAMFNDAFFTWLREAHPAAFEDIAPVQLANIPGLSFPAYANFGLALPRDPSEMAIAVEYVNEFVAQSDVYPLG